MDDKDCPNRSQLQTNKEKHDMRVDDKGPTNTMGLTIHTTAEKPHQDSNNPQYHKMENTSALKVYSRNGGCRKQEAYLSGNEKLTEANINLNKQQQPIVLIETANICYEGHKPPTDIAPLQPGM